MVALISIAPQSLMSGLLISCRIASCCAALVSGRRLPPLPPRFRTTSCRNSSDSSLICTADDELPAPRRRCHDRKTALAILQRLGGTDDTSQSTEEPGEGATFTPGSEDEPAR